MQNDISIQRDRQTIRLRLQAALSVCEHQIWDTATSIKDLISSLTRTTVLLSTYTVGINCALNNKRQLCSYTKPGGNGPLFYFCTWNEETFCGWACVLFLDVPGRAQDTLHHQPAFYCDRCHPNELDGRRMKREQICGDNPTKTLRKQKQAAQIVCPD